jgi:hypothetical protein
MTDQVPQSGPSLGLDNYVTGKPLSDSSPILMRQLCELLLAHWSLQASCISSDQGRIINPHVPVRKNVRLLGPSSDQPQKFMSRWRRISAGALRAKAH